MTPVTLKPSTNLSAASWITDAEEDWAQLAGFGPATLPGYVRVRILPDPEHPFQSENDAPEVPGALAENDLFRLLIEVLGGHTSTPGLGYFCLWDGWGTTIPGFRPMVQIPNRSYYLFEGPLRDAGQWGVEDESLVPAFVWPADQAWCLAKDVDQHWIGVGASEAALQDLLEVPQLDVVKADPAEQQPFYL